MSNRSVFSLLLGLVTAAAPVSAAAEKLVVLGVSAPQVDDMTLSFLDEALAAAAARVIGEPVLDAVTLKDKLKPGQLKQATQCDASRCWRNLGQQLEVAFILSTRSMKSSAGLVLSARLVRASDGRIIARAQRTMALDASAFAEGARELWKTLSDTAKQVEPGLFAAATAAAAPQPTAAVEPNADPQSAVPEIAPSATAIAPTVDPNAAPQGTNAPITATKPVARGVTEYVPEVEEGFEYKAPATPNVQALLAETKPVDKLWNATWRPGMGFTLEAAGGAPAGEGVHVSRPLQLPSLIYQSLDGIRVNPVIGVYDLKPPEAALGIGTVVLLDVGWRWDWREVASRLSPWLRLGFSYGFQVTFHALELRAGGDFGLLLHAVKGTRGRTLALGPYVGARLHPFFSFDTTMLLRPAEDPNTNSQITFLVDKEYGLKLQACPGASPGSASPPFTVEADLYRLGALVNVHDEVDFSSTATFARLTGSLNLGGVFLGLTVARRISVSEDWTYLTPAQLMSTQVAIAISADMAPPSVSPGPDTPVPVASDFSIVPGAQP